MQSVIPLFQKGGIQILKISKKGVTWKKIGVEETRRGGKIFQNKGGNLTF